MAPTNDDFLKKLLATFRVEAEEHLAAMSAGLLELERTAASETRMAIVEKVFREAHSLKGAARAVNHADIESACHALESLFVRWKNNGVVAEPPLLDLVNQVLDALAGILLSDTPASGSRSALAVLVQRLDQAPARQERAGVDVHAMQEPREPHPSPPSPSSAPGDESTVPRPARVPAAETIRIQVAKLDSVMRQTEELFAPRLAARQRVVELRETSAVLTAWKKERSKVQAARRSIDRLIARPDEPNGATKHSSELAKLLEYLDAEYVFSKAVESRVTKLERSAEEDQRALAGMVESLLQDVKEMHLLPFASLFEAFPRLVRELARDRGKRVELAITGSEIEIDRRILEEMKAPLHHLLRNSVDHGFETPEARVQRHKPPHGTLSIAVSHREGNVELVIADDGAGIDVARVKAVAVRRGLVSASEAEALAEQEIVALIFRSGFSTSPIITEISGRGLGLSIVVEKVDRLGGTIAVESRPDAGTTVRIVLPLTLATFRGVLVRAGDQLFIVPAASVERVARIPATEVLTVENRETIAVGGQTLSLVWLSDVLELSRSSSESVDNVPAIVLGLAGDRIAFRVDEVVAEQEVLVKGLGRQLARVRNIAGATVLGSGEVVPVLNVPDLMRSAVNPTIPRRVVRATENAAEAPKQSILVVEDSITARTLLKNVLEAAGYAVSTAVDGVDAYTTLKTGTFDLIVSDVEMPRMDGFDLTAKVRADKQLSALPVVLVTALESREHRERGIDAGANAYIVKSSFDQSNLLEVVRRLIS